MAVQRFERALEGEHDVVIVDYRLGARNGLELVREAVHLGCGMPFIVLTGEGNREIDLEAMRAGATDYLVKGEITAPLARTLDPLRHRAPQGRAPPRRCSPSIDQLTGLANRYHVSANSWTAASRIADRQRRPMVGSDADRPEPLQGRERHLRPRRRRHAAQARSPAA